MSDYLLFKWGTLKGWQLNDSADLPGVREAFDKWVAGGVSMSAMAQANDADQKKAICDLIDAVSDHCELQNDWSGEKYTKEEAKNYIMTYGD